MNTSGNSSNNPQKSSNPSGSTGSGGGKGPNQPRKRKFEISEVETKEEEKKKKLKKNRERYYDKTREQQIEKSKNYREINRAKVNAAARAKYDKNKEERNEKKRNKRDLDRTESILDSDLKEVQDAIYLDSVLPEYQKSDKRYLQEIKEQYSTFFDEESGNTIEEGLKQVEDYLMEEKSSTSFAKLSMKSTKTNQPQEKGKKK
jgi:hypothetical protein